MLKFSEASSLAIHAMVYLAAHTDKRLSNSHIASELNVSEAHLSKVLQRLRKVGLVRSSRGPNGGFEFAKPSSKIALLDVLEAIDGPFQIKECLFMEPKCSGNKCIFGNILLSVSDSVKNYLENTYLSDLHDVFSKKGGFIQ